jgi:hypothetical protein
MSLRVSLGLGTLLVGAVTVTDNEAKAWGRLDVWDVTANLWSCYGRGLHNET